ncbi:MAG: AAA family ATPase [Methanosarcinales archaeon]
MKLILSNWRCIDNLEIDLSKINVFLGKNSTGKSSIGYAMYLASKVSSSEENPNKIANLLLGDNLENLVRIYNNKKAFPLEIYLENEARNLRIKVGSDQKPIVEKNGSLWSEEYLLVSGRYGLIISYQILSNILSYAQKDAPQLISIIYGFADLFFKEIHLTAPAQILINDIIKSIGIPIPIFSKKISGLGKYEIVPWVQVLAQVFKFYDMFNENIKLNANAAPSGLVDRSIIEHIINNAKKGSLIVIEEPEEHQNPTSQIDLINSIISKAKEQELTLVITTHSEICVLALIKAIREKILNSKDLSMYYLERDEKHPWTRCKKIEISEDGTIDPIPDSIEVTVHLF